MPKSVKPKVVSTKAAPKIKKVVPKTPKAVVKCKGKTTKGTPCTRKGSKDHGGYCFQHDPNAEHKPAKIVKSVKKPSVKTKKSSVKKLSMGNSKSTHPPYKVMVAMAISAYKDPKGSSLPSIKNYMAANFKVEADKNAIINRTIANACKSGELVKNPKHLGHYRLSADFKKQVEVTLEPTQKKSSSQNDESSEE